MTGQTRWPGADTAVAVEPETTGHSDDLVMRSEGGTQPTVQSRAYRFYVRALHEGWPHSVIAGALPPGSPKFARGAIDAGDGPRRIMRQPVEGYCEGMPSTSGWALR
jgi:hypothetical protein